MPVDIGSYFNSAVDTINNGMLSNVFGNSLHMSLLLTCIIFVIVWAIYADDRKFKTFFYIFCAVFGTMLLHHSVLTSRIKTASSDQMVGEISGGLDELQPLSHLGD
jgi:hypothetical protein